MITREQVADLQPGDVVVLTFDKHPDAFTRGPLVPDGGDLKLAMHIVRQYDGEPWHGDERSLTVVSRAPRPLYVNHDRAEPVPGDVVRDADSDRSPRVWMHLGGGRNDWAGHRIGDMVLFTSGEMPARLRLLVDGETGQVVPATPEPEAGCSCGARGDLDFILDHPCPLGDGS